ncbi:MAG: GNAT family N-acetyltransferase [Eubacteriales bacterium]|nr:GNAT family N-acetyltransferase [Eubacteriales bacterium]
MLIKLIEVEQQDRLEEMLAAPAAQEDRVLYVTGQPDFAKALIERALPCIFLEREPADIFGADMIIMEDQSREWDWRSDRAFLESIWKRHYHLPWTIAETERLLIRETIPEDLPALLEIYAQETGNKDVKLFSKEPEEELLAYISKRYGLYGYGLWTVAEKSSEDVIGRIGFEECSNEKVCGDNMIPELQYMIRREARKKGYAYEAAAAILEYVRQQYGFEKAVLRTSAENTASCNLAEKLGFRRISGTDNAERVFLEVQLK